MVLRWLKIERKYGSVCRFQRKTRPVLFVWRGKLQIINFATSNHKTLQSKGEGRIHNMTNVECAIAEHFLFSLGIPVFRTGYVQALKDFLKRRHLSFMDHCHYCCCSSLLTVMPILNMQFHLPFNLCSLNADFFVGS